MESVTANYTVLHAPHIGTLDNTGGNLRQTYDIEISTANPTKIQLGGMGEKVQGWPETHIYARKL